jgi:hypothetical protein
VPRIGISRSEYYVPKAGFDDRVRARARSTEGGTWFQCDVEDGAFWYWPVKTAKAFDFCVRRARAHVMALRHDLSGNHEDSAYGRVGTR